MSVPDNETILEISEYESDRQKRVKVKIEEIEPQDLPFYYDSIGIRETFGKGINDGRIKNSN